MKITDNKIANQLVNDVAYKFDTLNQASITLYGLHNRKRRHRFISKGLLDYYLTQIPPSKLAEYKRAITIKE
jgi:hypothetical protein